MEKIGNYTNIIDLKNGVRHLRIKAIVLSIRASNSKNGEQFYRLIVADSTARINCTLFDQRAAFLKSGDIIYMSECYTREFKSELTIYKFSQGNIFKIDEFCMLFNDKVDMSVKKEEIAANTTSDQKEVKIVEQDVVLKKASSEKVNNSPKPNFMNGRNYKPITGPKRSFASLAQNSQKINRRRSPMFKAFALRKKNQNFRFSDKNQ